MKQAIAFLKSFRAKVTLALVLSMLFIGAMSNFLIYEYSLKAQFEQLRSKLVIMAKAATLQIEADTVIGVPLTKDGTLSPQYGVLTERLSRFNDIEPAIAYAYILTKTGRQGLLKFVIDVRSKSAPENRPPAYPGEEYDASRFPELLNGFNGPSADRKLAADEWGMSLSGYAPILDKDGKSIAMLGIDVNANDVYNIQKEVRRRAQFVMLIGLALSLALGMLISGRIAGPIRKLAEGTRHLARGELDYKIDVKGSTEIMELARSMNRMSADLKSHIEVLKRTTAERERLMRELEIARGIQQSFLPQALPYLKGLDMAVFCIPASIVGGDFYDFIPLEHGKWGLVVADVSGRGIPAALFMALSRTIFNITAKERCPVHEIVGKANRLITENNKANMFVTLFYAVLDEERSTLTYANAGHNPSLLIREGREDIHLLMAQGIPLGMFSDNEMTSEEIKLKKGDIIVLYTDGIVEAINFGHEQFGIERLSEVVKTNCDLPSGKILEKVRDALNGFVGNEPQFDDMTMMVLKVV
jgi:serine phosphatase RsbU (regulator of sigma subunit)